MQQVRPSEPPGLQASLSEHAGIASTTDRDPAEESVESAGLCSTCNHLPICTFPCSNQHSVMFCEEFDGVVRATTPVAMTERLPPAVRDRRIDATEHSSKYRGLCRTCEHHEGCTFPRTEGGVWQCEEFA